MADTLGARVGRIVSGSAHALIDAIEGTMPDAVIQQTLREIDKAVDDVRAELGRTIASKHLANKRLTEQSSRHEELSGQTELALREGREDLARAAVEHQLDVEAQIPVLEATVADAVKREIELEGYVAALQAKRREMEEAFQSMLLARARSAQEAGAASTPEGGTSVTRRVENATGAFDRLMAREGAPGLGGVDREQGAKLAELDNLARRNRVEERLAAVKARTGDQG
ncbi:phage shock protein A [Brevundimonas nasdae]|uniref:PspA/IM30 family protein n=1 Tax=Brevundimonas nasdae TaxID=172043 RepID=UPI0019113BB5|nr:PspA/IM30 family protein [Brevundimonas nasdae]MBK6023939.1 PspA/IM30 family protein [Brevundimonas nasdae]MDQ0450593.1 phage shock protein A [Brevundimonas nasdae]